MSESLLTVDAVDAAYGSASVLHKVSLRVDPGEMVFIAGRNGAGKTTLLKTIAGFMPPRPAPCGSREGPAGIRPEKVARLGVRYVFQDKRVFSKLTVRENLELAAHPSGERMSDVVTRMVSIYPAMEKFLDSKAGD